MKAAGPSKQEQKYTVWCVFERPFLEPMTDHGAYGIEEWHGTEMHQGKSIGTQ
jgi:hypothetical protein